MLGSVYEVIECPKMDNVIHFVNGLHFVNIKNFDMHIWSLIPIFNCLKRMCILLFYEIRREKRMHRSSISTVQNEKQNNPLGP